MMAPNVARRTLTILLAAVAVFDIADGLLTLSGAWTPATAYQGTLFAGTTLPMLLLAIVVGGSALLAAATVFIRHRLALFIAVAAGLIMVAWEITVDAVTHQFTVAFPFPVFVAVGLTIIALAEYLWTTESRGEPLPPVRHEAIRIALVVLEAIVGAAAIDGGLALLRGVFDQYVPPALLAGTPFTDYTIPGLVLVILVGGTALLAAATAFIHREWAVVVSMLAGMFMASYEVVEIASIDSKLGDSLPIALAAQLLFFSLGLAILGLAWSLWSHEFRGQRLRLRHAGHA